MSFCCLFGKPSRHLRQALLFAGIAGFSTAILIHPVIGYLSASHLAPAVFGCGAYFAGLALSSIRSPARAGDPVLPAAAP